MTIKLFGVIETDTEEVQLVISEMTWVITLPFFPHEMKSVFFEILLPNSKLTIAGTIYRPPNQSNFLEVLNENMNKTDSIINEVYILSNFNINLYLNDSYICSK